MKPLAAAALIGRPPPPGKRLPVVQLGSRPFLPSGVKAESRQVEQTLALDGGRSEVAPPPGRLAGW